MPLEPAITDLEQLKTIPPSPELMAWNPDAVEGAKFDRDEISFTWSGRRFARLACCCGTTRIARLITWQT